MKTILCLLLALAMTGCATNPEYIQYAKSAEAASVARSNALAEIAKSGDGSAKVAAVMALAFGAGNQQMQAPQASGALQWASILVPGLTQIAGIAANMHIGITQSNNAARVAESTNGTMLGIAGQIQAAPTITTTTDRHDVYTPAPVITPVTPIVPVVVNPPTVIEPVVQITPVFVP